MLTLLVWSHAIEFGDIVATKIQPAAAEKSDFHFGVIAEHSDLDLMLYSRRSRLPMQELEPISVAHSLSSIAELGASNPLSPSKKNALPSCSS